MTTTLSASLLLRELGVKLPDDVKGEAEIKIIINNALHLFDESSLDPTLSRASYGIAVFTVSAALNVTLRTAALLFETAIISRSIKYQTSDNSKPTSTEIIP